MRIGQLLTACLLCAQLLSCRGDGNGHADADADSDVEPDIDGDAGGDADSDGDAAQAPRRVVAIGDHHGDLGQAVRALTAAGVIDETQAWTGGTTLVVQLGDVLDRGDEEREVIDLYEDLRLQAEAAGGEVVSLNGNHELMNAYGDYRYVTDGACAAFSELVGLDTDRPEFGGLSPECQIRAAAFWPGGPYATVLAEWPMVLVAEDSVFVHGGLLGHHVDYGIAEINAETRAWLRGTGAMPSDMVGFTDDAVDWDRTYSDGDSPPTAADCAVLEGVLDRLDVSRMVVAHSPQDEINPACDGAVWRVDVGMAAHYGGRVQVLEILGDELTVIEAP